MTEKKEKRAPCANEDLEAGESNELLSKTSLPVEDVMNLVIFLRDRTGIHFTLEDASTTTASALLDLVITEQGLPAECYDIFSLWLVSPIIELRLKKHHNPFEVVQKWNVLCSRYTDATNDEINQSEPVLMVQRDVFYQKEEEQYIESEQILCLLYHEAKYNVVEGRYILHEEDYHHLAGIQSLIDLGPYDTNQHILTHYRANLVKFYPDHMFAQSRFSFLNRSSVNVTPCEISFMQAHKRATEEMQLNNSEGGKAQLYKKYLQLLWTYPFYGGAYFSGVVEAKMNRILRLILPNHDLRVSICINTDGVTIFNRAKHELVLYVPYSQLSWIYRDLPWDGDNDPPPTLMLQFICDETRDESNGQPITKLLQIYSREAKLMDALIQTCVNRKLELQNNSSIDNDFVDAGIRDGSEKKILNKIEKLFLETYTQDGDQLEID